METASPSPQTPPPAPASRPLNWLWALGLLVVGVILGLAFAAYGGADLLLNYTNLRYCG